MRASLDRIERLNSSLNAFISVYPELALAAAREAEAEIQAGRYRGPLHGVPIAVKDLFQVAGMTRTCGSRLMDEGPAEADAASVGRLKAAGAIVVGLLNLNEFAYGATGINPHFGSARNPWDRQATCGGSSSGAGCAVAASMVPAALGTDTGGSIRIPAALTGVVGLKQTYGLVGRRGIYPLCDSFDHGGPLARSVRDAATMLGAIAGEDEGDPATRGVRAGDYTARLDAGVEGLRIGVPREFFFDDLHPETRARVRTAIDSLAGLGAAPREVSLPYAEQAVEDWQTMALAEAYVVHETHVTENPGRLATDVEARVLLGRGIPARDYLKARERRVEAKRKMAVPTTPYPAPRIDTGCIEVEGRHVEGAKVLGRLTRLAAYTGQPAVSVPCGFTDAGLPVGLQLIGRWFGEAELLAIANAYERSTPWYDRHPEGLA